MANTFKYAYSQSVANKLPGSNQNYFFRTVVRYELDSNGKPTGKSTSQLYYLPSAEKGSGWKRGDENTGEGFNSQGYVLAAESSDGGATWTPKQYTVEDVDKHSNVSAGRVGENVLGETALQSLQTPGGRFYDTAQNSIINTAVSTKVPNLASSVSAKRKNAAATDGNNNGTNPNSGNNGGNNGDNNSGNKDQSDSEPPTVDVPDELTNVQSREKYAKELVYPEALRQRTQDYLKIQMVEYKPRKTASNDTGSLAIQSRTNLQRGGELAKDKDGKPFRELLSTIYLPIPGGISDNNTANWSKGDVDVLEGIGANLLNNVMNNDASGLKDATTNTAGAVQNNVSGVKIAAKRSIIKELTGVDLLKRTLGAVANQNTELLFDGPGLRSFSFTFKFSPRGKKEAIVVKKIIRTLKQGMSPKKANNFLFIKSPHTFFLSYHHGTEIHPFLNKFKECALSALSVNYTPDGNYATYYDGSMISYQVTMSFQELEPVFDSDYGNGYNNIGF